MAKTVPEKNARFIERELAWLAKVVDLRMQLHAEGSSERNPLEELAPPSPRAAGSSYSRELRRLDLDAAERLLLILAYAPHVRPSALDPFFIRNRSLDRRFTEFGGLVGLSHGGFLPTAETGMFLLAGEILESRLEHLPLFDAEHRLYSENVLRLDHRHTDEPPLSAGLSVTPEYLERLTTGRRYYPPFSALFPAQRITTPYEWEDLVLDDSTLEEIEDILTWVRHHPFLLEEWGLAKRLKPGYLTLFYGPSGTGKTLTATLLGKATGLPVYRIDLSRVISKYIGETEKNLASLFDQAEHQQWILFFDEAEALFGKRTESRTANDRAANQQIAYLLQRIEDYPGIAILATNLRSHLDEAFARRFQAMIRFPIPSFEQRLRLWEDNFADKSYPLADDVDLRSFARDYELAGGSIVNVLRYACLQAILRRPPEVRHADILHGIERELRKAGRLINAAD